jgi:hypothetical protein
MRTGSSDQKIATGTGTVVSSKSDSASWSGESAKATDSVSTTSIEVSDVPEIWVRKPRFQQATPALPLHLLQVVVLPNLAIRVELWLGLDTSTTTLISETKCTFRACICGGGGQLSRLFARSQWDRQA